MESAAAAPAPLNTQSTAPTTPTSSGAAGAKTVAQALAEEEAVADGAAAPAAVEARPSRRRWITGAVVFAIAAPVVWYVGTQPLVRPGAVGITGSGGAAKGVGPLADYEAPNFRLKDPAGKTVELKQLRGKPVLLNFWATWCAPCRDEMPELEQLYREHKDKDGLVVLAVSVDESRAARDIPEFLKEGHPSVGAFTFPVALDEKQEVLKQYKLQGVPQSYFIDAAGVIRVVQPRVMNRQMMLDSLAHILPSTSGASGSAR